jgi:hypothetical protein
MVVSSLKSRQKVDDGLSAPQSKSIQTILRVYFDCSGSIRRAREAIVPAVIRQRA